MVWKCSFDKLATLSLYVASLKFETKIVKKGKDIPYYSPNRNSFPANEFSDRKWKSDDLTETFAFVHDSLYIVQIIFLLLYNNYEHFWHWMTVESLVVDLIVAVCKSIKSWWKSKRSGWCNCGWVNEGFWCLLLLSQYFEGIFFFLFFFFVYLFETFSVFVPIRHDSFKVNSVSPSSVHSLPKVGNIGGICSFSSTLCLWYNQCIVWMAASCFYIMEKLNCLFSCCSHRIRNVEEYNA